MPAGLFDKASKSQMLTKSQFCQSDCKQSQRKPSNS